MPSITDSPPQAIQAEMAELATALDTDVPPKALDRILFTRLTRENIDESSRRS